MISWACGRRSMGKIRSRAGPLAARAAICGVSEDVAQVSSTSGSAANPPGRPRCSPAYPGGGSAAGSTGSRASSGTIGVS
jgi:hypothetical protein